MASSVIIIDTSVFIDHVRTNRYATRIESLSGLIRNSADDKAQEDRCRPRSTPVLFLTTRLFGDQALLCQKRPNLAVSALVFCAAESAVFAAGYCYQLFPDADLSECLL